MTNLLLERAAVSRPLASGRGLLERLFTLMFQGFVYNQIWEDPAVDLEALALAPQHHLVTIASGGCNILNYLAASPARISAVDLNPNHVALARLKLAALKHLPGHAEFFRFFGEANDRVNAGLFDRHLASNLDARTLAYWTERKPLGGRRIEMFGRDLYRHGLLGRFIGLLHGVARLHGKRLDAMLAAQDLEEQRVAFETIIAPLFESPPVRLLSKSPVSLYALGIPPAQYEALVDGGDAIAVLRERTRRLACDFPIAENYFAWQAFGRSYDLTERRAVPDYLRADNFQTLRGRAGQAQVHLASMTDFLRRQPPASLHRFVLLDAQDWMNESQLAELWTEIDRTADGRDARVIFRTAGADSPLPGKLPPALLAPWVYREAESRLLHARDRSSIYGGFHLYVRGRLQ
jgi:S-adenosylmethionine-diacylglycerol 3-amino-3-carboxypropyl transferase